MTVQISESPLATDIRISILSDHEWRICDRRIPETNAESVLGYIEKTGDFYEVMKLASPRNLSYFTDFEHAVDCFAVKSVRATPAAPPLAATR